jgi:hypothetical protein
VGGFLRILIYGKIGLAHDAAMLSTQAWVINNHEAKLAQAVSHETFVLSPAILMKPQKMVSLCRQSSSSLCLCLYKKSVRLKSTSEKPLQDLA